LKKLSWDCTLVWFIGGINARPPTSTSLVGTQSTSNGPPSWIREPGIGEELFAESLAGTSGERGGSPLTPCYCVEPDLRETLDLPLSPVSVPETVCANRESGSTSTAGVSARAIGPNPFSGRWRRQIFQVWNSERGSVRSGGLTN